MIQQFVYWGYICIKVGILNIEVSVYNKGFSIYLYAYMHIQF